MSQTREPLVPSVTQGPEEHAPPELPTLSQREDLPSSPAEPENQSYSEENPRCSTRVRLAPERLTASKMGFPAYLDEDTDFLYDSGVSYTLNSDHIESYFKQEPSFLIPSCIKLWLKFLT